MDAITQAETLKQLSKARTILEHMMYIALPEGKTMDDMAASSTQSVRNPNGQRYEVSKVERTG